MGVLAAIYFTAATLGLSLAVVHENVSLVWPPTGIALAALLLFGYRLWPGVALGAFLINASTDVTLATAAGIGIGNTLEALTGAYLLQRVVQFRNSLERRQDVLGLVVLAAGLSTTVSATIGASSLCLGGAASWALYGSLWWQWWLGDAMGALVVAPVLLTWATDPRVRWEPRRVAEAGALLALLAGVSQSVFGGWLPIISPTYPLAFAIFPFVIWAALRFGSRGAAMGTLVVSAFAIWGTWGDLGPFLGTTLTESLLLLQTFISVIAVTGLLLAAGIIQRERAEQELGSVKDQLLQLELYQRQRTEQVLLESEARKGAILEAALDCIITIDHAGKIIDFNPAAEKTFGFTRTQVLGKEMAELIIPPALREKHRRGLAHYLATGEGPVLGKRLKMSAVRADGTEFPVELAITRIRLGGPPMFTGHLRDITEQTQAEESLRESESRYRTLARMTPVGIFRTDAAGNCIYVNERWCEIAGLTPEEARGEGWAQCLHPDDTERIFLEWSRTAKERVPFNSEYRFQRRDGVTTWVLGQAIPEEGPAGEVIGHVGTITDITLRKHSEAEAERRRQEAEVFAGLVTDLAASLELEALLEQVMIQTKQLSQADLGFIAVPASDGQSLTIRAHTGASSSAVAALRIPRGKGIAGMVLETGEPLTTTDYLQDLRFPHTEESDAVARTEGTVAAAGVPIIYRETTLGVLLVGRRTPQPFTADQLRVLTRLADAASVAFHHALLYQQASHWAATLERLWQVGQGLSRPLALAETLDRIVEAARDLLRVASAQLAQRGAAADLVTITAEAGDLALLRHRTVRLGEGTIGTVAATRQPLILNDYQEFPNRLPELTTVRAAMAVPLLVEDRLVGIINVDSTEQDRTFSREDLQLLELLAQPAAVALENARLYEAVKLEAYQLEHRVEERTQELHVAMRRAEEASRYKSDFLANMSHELRTPLNSIIGFSELLLTQNYGPLNEKQARHANNILVSSRHLLTLINDILDLSKVEAGRLELHLEAFGLPEIVKGVVADIRPQAGARGVELRVEAAEAPERLTADPVRFKQILYNLLSNAVKFTPEGGRVTVAARQAEGKFVEIAVTDTGIGIAAEDIARLFEPFTQLEAAATKRHQGTGLGLALTKKFVELHGGTITVSSEGTGKGTTFTVHLPLAPAG